MARIVTRKAVTLLAALTFGILALSLSAGCSAAGPKYPSKPIDLIVAYAPGGGSDLSARLIAPYASKKLGQPVNVVNVTGASGITGTMQVMNAKPDGYTIMIDNTSNTTFLAAAQSNLPFKLEDKTWLGQWIADPMFYMFNADTPFKSLKDAMDFARANPEKYTWGAGAQASQSMFHGLTLLMDAGVDPNKTKMVVFPEGMAPSVQAVLSGTVMEAGAMAADVEKLLPTGKVKILGVGTQQRVKKYPDVPTAKEQGFPTSTLVSWYGLSGPKGLPQEVIDTWAKLLTDASKDPEFQAEADKQNKVLGFLSPKEQQDYVMKEYADMTKLAEKVGIRK